MDFKSYNIQTYGDVKVIKIPIDFISMNKNENDVFFIL